MCNLLGLFDLHVVWWFCEVSGFCLSGYLSTWLSTASSKMYIFHFFDFLLWLQIYKNQGPYHLKKTKKNNLIWFLKNFISQLYYKCSWMKALVIIVFLLQTHPIYIQKGSWFWYLPQKVLIQSESIGFGQSYQTLTWAITFQDSWNPNNSRKV